MPDEQPATCGEGLALNAVVPERIAALLNAMADVLQGHTRSLDAGNANARLERETYERLVRDQRAIASSLSALVEAMRSRDLPPAPHDERALSDQRSIDVFRAFIGAEEDMLALLQENVREHRAMLSARGPAKARRGKFGHLQGMRFFPSNGLIVRVERSIPSMHRALTETGGGYCVDVRITATPQIGQKCCPPVTERQT
jgi:hypothetical protein